MAVGLVVRERVVQKDLHDLVELAAVGEPRRRESGVLLFGIGQSPASAWVGEWALESEKVAE